MKFNQWTLGLAAAGVVSLGSVAQAAEEKSTLATALSGTVLSGHVSTSVIFNPNSNNGTGYGRFNDGATKQDGFNLDHVRLQLERPMGEGEWAAGYKVELLFGDDAAFYGTSTGAGTQSIDGDVEGSEIAIKQAYVALRAPVGNGLDLKMGVWDTIIGYEVFNPQDNPNFSRSYAYFVEPFAHTGLLASYRISDELAISAGIANSTSTAGNVNQINGRGDGEFRIRYMAGVSYTMPEDSGFLKGSTLYGGFVSSEDGATVGGTGDGYNVYLGGTLATPVEGLRVGAAFDAVVADNAGDTYVYGLYATFQATEQIRISGRGEFVQDNGGIIFDGAAGQEVMSLVGTVDYKLWDNVLTRAEVRWDKDTDGGSGDAFDGQDNQIQFVLNVVYSF